ncbi:hypothetical protein BT96DRAFT_1006045 [Gymnopus androsaceus JB14]|uniref:Uncharacterized protein n=1 Tax=Gymnopus androsaceus JB14 TaxID=1447944 RepID=A0A6A4GLP8_9AGAR|nr:hypothetical protein BT96DRAFT_1006045 [Gymnopus androsaceus JB14]
MPNWSQSPPAQSDLDEESFPPSPEISCLSTPQIPFPSQHHIFSQYETPTRTLLQHNLNIHEMNNFNRFPQPQIPTMQQKFEILHNATESDLQRAGNAAYNLLYSKCLELTAELNANRKLNKTLGKLVAQPPRLPKFELWDLLDHETDYTNICFNTLTSWTDYKKNKANSSQKAPHNLGFLQSKNSTYIVSAPNSKDQMSAIWQTSKSIWSDLYIADVDPESWGVVNTEIGDYFYARLASIHPEFCYCNNGKWKAKVYATVKYPDFTTNVRDKGKLQRDPTIKVLRSKRPSPNNVEPPLKKKRKKNLKINTTTTSPISLTMPIASGSGTTPSPDIASNSTTSAQSAGVSLSPEQLAGLIPFDNNEFVDPSSTRLSPSPVSSSAIIPVVPPGAISSTSSASEPVWESSGIIPVQGPAPSTTAIPTTTIVNAAGDGSIATAMGAVPTTTISDVAGDGSTDTATTVAASTTINDAAGDGSTDTSGVAPLALGSNTTGVDPFTSHSVPQTVPPPSVPFTSTVKAKPVPKKQQPMVLEANCAITGRNLFAAEYLKTHEVTTAKFTAIYETQARKLKKNANKTTENPANGTGSRDNSVPGGAGAMGDSRER